MVGCRHLRDAQVFITHQPLDAFGCGIAHVSEPDHACACPDRVVGHAFDDPLERAAEFEDDAVGVCALDVVILDVAEDEGHGKDEGSVGEVGVARGDEQRVDAVVGQITEDVEWIVAGDEFGDVELFANVAGEDVGGLDGADGRDAEVGLGSGRGAQLKGSVHHAQDVAGEACVVVDVCVPEDDGDLGGGCSRVGGRRIGASAGGCLFRGDNVPEEGRCCGGRRFLGGWGEGALGMQCRGCGAGWDDEGSDALDAGDEDQCPGCGGEEFAGIEFLADEGKDRGEGHVACVVQDREPDQAGDILVDARPDGFGDAQFLDAFADEILSCSEVILVRESGLLLEDHLAPFQFRNQPLHHRQGAGLVCAEQGFAQRPGQLLAFRWLV